MKAFLVLSPEGGVNYAHTTHGQADTLDVAIDQAKMLTGNGAGAGITELVIYQAVRVVRSECKVSVEEYKAPTLPEQRAQAA